MSNDELEIGQNPTNPTELQKILRSDLDYVRWLKVNSNFEFLNDKEGTNNTAYIDDLPPDTDFNNMLTPGKWNVNNKLCTYKNGPNSTWTGVLDIFEGDRLLYQQITCHAPPYSVWTRTQYKQSKFWQTWWNSQLDFASLSAGGKVMQSYGVRKATQETMLDVLNQLIDNLTKAQILSTRFKSEDEE